MAPPVLARLVDAAEDHGFGRAHVRGFVPGLRREVSQVGQVTRVALAVLVLPRAGIGAAAREGDLLAGVLGRRGIGLREELAVGVRLACELFVLELTLRAAKGQENEKVITRADVVAAIKNAATMDFLRGVVDPSMAPSADEIAAAEEEDL